MTKQLNHLLITGQSCFYMRVSVRRKLNNIEFTDMLSYSRLESHST